MANTMHVARKQEEHLLREEAAVPCAGAIRLRSDCLRLRGVCCFLPAHSGQPRRGRSFASVSPGPGCVFVGRATSSGTDRQTVPHVSSGPSCQWPLPLACGRQMRCPRPRSVRLRVLRLPHVRRRGDLPVRPPSRPARRTRPATGCITGSASPLSKRPDQYTRKPSRCGLGPGPNPAERCTLPPTVCRGSHTVGTVSTVKSIEPPPIAAR